METVAVSDGQISIRRAGPEDAAAIARLLHDFNTEFGEPTAAVEALSEYARRLLAAGEMTVLLAGEGPDGISLIRFRDSVWTGGPEAHLQELYVAPPLRGRGIGRALLEAPWPRRARRARPGSTSTPAPPTPWRALYMRAAGSPIAKARRTAPRCSSTSAIYRDRREV
jgi:GNAT superfamily N-acetyltransferase